MPKETCNQIRRQHKEIEEKNNLIFKDDANRVRIKKSYKCDKRNRIQFNRNREYEMFFLADKRQKYFNQCVKSEGIKQDIGHKYIIKEYKKRGNECGKIITEQIKKEKEEKKKIKKTSDLTINQLKKILKDAKQKTSYMNKKKLVEKVEELKLIKDFDKLKL